VGSGVLGAELSVTRTGSGSASPGKVQKARGARLFGGAVRSRWDPTVGARGAPGDHTHIHTLRAQGTRRGKSLPLPNLTRGLERAQPVSPEQQLHSRRGSGPTRDKSLGFTLQVQEKTPSCVMEGVLGSKGLPAPSELRSQHPAGAEADAPPDSPADRRP